ncbi:uncharacterized protein OCT59_018491 [Rhizophagus irregularis]|uniref:uncharacterized protein n=1 Tax=Rhizophagus irregularis TaxID=588596 RepID=UPI0033282E1E|nr:hypothetical protein OCT59_018491 [Rhizophagus irregularis]
MSTKNTKKKTGKNAKKKTKVFHNSSEKKDEAYQKTGNILFQILSVQSTPIADDVSSQDTGNVDDNASASTSYTETHTGPDYNNILTSTPHTEGPFVLVVPDEILKSSTSNNPTKSIKSGKPKKNWGRSLMPIIGNNLTRNLENSPTKPDDDLNQKTFTPIRAPTPIRASTPITLMQIDDEYYSQTIQRLMVINKLSDEFWNCAYKKVSKELILKILFPSDTEYHKALEKYLAEHASHYIENLGRNMWVSLFESKLLPEIKNKCQSKQNDLAANIRNTIFSNFGEQKLECVDSSILTKITSFVFKSYEGSELPPEHWVYVLAICDIILNSSSPGIKCNDKLVLKRVDFLMQSIKNKVTVTLRLLQELAVKEDSEQSLEISSMIKESSDADDGNSSSYEKLLKSLDSKFS